MEKIGKIIFMFSVLGMVVILTVITLLQSDNMTGFSVFYPHDVITTYPRGELYKDQSIKLDLKIYENYLGQISVRFYNYDRINEDSVLFRIKEKGSNSWYYEHIYKTDQFQPHHLFPFGFPVIQNSRGKEYQIEIISQSGKPDDAVTLSSSHPQVASAHQFPKKGLITNPSLLVEFLVNKIKYSHVSLDTFISLGKYVHIITLSTVFLYLLFNNVIVKFVHFRQNVSSLILITGLVLLIVGALLHYVHFTSISSIIIITSYFLFLLSTVLFLIENKIVGGEKRPSTSDKVVRKKKKV